MSDILRHRAGIPVGGQFASHNRSEGDIVLTAGRTSRTALAEALAAGENVDRRPVGITQTRAALSNVRGEPDGAIRVVELTWGSVPPASPTDDFEVRGPKDGRPLVVLLRTGLPRLKITSGNVVVVADSSAGNAVTFSGESSGILIASEGCKVSVLVDGKAQVEYFAEPRGWGLLNVEGDAQVDYFGDPELHGVNLPRPVHQENSGDTCRVTVHE